MAVKTISDSDPGREADAEQEVPVIPFYLITWMHPWHEMGMGGSSYNFYRGLRFPWGHVRPRVSRLSRCGKARKALRQAPKGPKGVTPARFGRRVHPLTAAVSPLFLPFFLSRFFFHFIYTDVPLTDRPVIVIL
jgi:hypothetical protein